MEEDKQTVSFILCGYNSNIRSISERMKLMVSENNLSANFIREAKFITLTGEGYFNNTQIGDNSGNFDNKEGKSAILFLDKNRNQNVDNFINNLETVSDTYKNLSFIKILYSESVNNGISIQLTESDNKNYIQFIKKDLFSVSFALNPKRDFYTLNTILNM